MVILSSNGAWTALPFLLLLSLLGKSSLLFEWLSVAALRQRIGYPAECPPVSAADLSDSLLMWIGAVARGVTSPSRWHRARPPA